MRYSALRAEDDGRRSGIVVEVGDVLLDERRVLAGDRAVAGHVGESGGQLNGRSARVLVVEKMPDLSSLKDRVWEGKEPFLVLVKDSRRAMALMSAAWYGHPARELKTIGVTGTKGKTTATYMVKSII